MKLHTMRIPCLDLNKSENFYTNLLGWKKTFGSVEDGFVGYRLENIDVMLEAQEQGEFECGRFLGFSLGLSDIQHFYEEGIKKGISFTGPPEQQTWGGVMTHLEDCNGNTFSIVQD